MKAIERVVKYLDYKGFNNRSFELKVGLSNGYLATQIKRNADLGEGILIKVLDNCLDLSPEWLLTGKDEMLKNEIFAPPEGSVMQELEQLRRENALKDKVIAGLERENELLREKVQEKSNISIELEANTTKHRAKLEPKQSEKILTT